MALKKTFQIKAKLLYNKRVKDAYFRLTLEAPDIARQASPGQFISVKIGETLEPLLRRPFSIYRVSRPSSIIPGPSERLKPDVVEILYEVVGEGTEILSRRKAGEYLDIIGPLGSGFSLQLTAYSLQLPILIAGGIGVAPLLFLAASLRAPQGRSNLKSGIASASPRKDNLLSTSVVVLLGARTKNQLLCEKEFKDLGCDVKIATDDGSRGFKGKVTDLLKAILRGTRDEGRGTIYACGPRLMLKEIAAISKQHNIPAQVSMEEHMACGIGACLGCVVKTRNEGRGTRDGFIYKRVCKEGPVFKAHEIIW